MVKKHLWKSIVKMPAFLAGFMLLLTPLSGKCRQVSITPVTLQGINANINIVDMCQDNNGFIWLATGTYGLCKYDGIRVKDYLSNENNPNSICSNKLECLAADKDGNIWIGSFENGLDRFDPATETFTHYRHDSADPSTIRCDSIRAITESHDGIMWVGTTKGLDSFDPATGKFNHIDDHSAATSDLNSGQVRALYEDKAGVMWIGCGSPFPGDYANNLNITKSIPGGLFKLDRTTGKLTEYRHKDGDKTSLIDNRVRAIFEDSRGTFWVGTAGDGLHIMDRKKGTFQRLRYDPKNPQKLSRPPVNNASLFAGAADHITFINEDSQGCIWIGTYAGGINRYNPATNRVEYFGTSAAGENKLYNDDFWRCLKTKDNLLWISTTWLTRGPALYKISTESGHLNYSRTGESIGSFVQDRGGNIWFASDIGLLRKNNNNSYDRFLPDKNMPGIKNTISGLELDARDNLWVTTQQAGLYYFDTKAQVFKAYRHNAKNTNSISSDTVSATQVNNDGTIWIGTYKGLDLLDVKTGIFKHYKNNTASSNFVDNIIYDCKKDSSGNIWIGTPNGLYRIKSNTGEFIEMVKMSYMDAQNIFEDSRHRIWVGSDRGLLVRYPDRNDFTWFADSTGLISNTLGVAGITEDKEHALWLVTRNGLIRLNPETKSAAIFGKSWGINPASLTGSIFTSSQGEIFMGDTAGYYHFFPKDFEPPGGNLSNLYLGNFYLDNNEIIPGSGNILTKPLSETKKITLSYLQNNFTFGYDNIDYLTDPSEKNVLYKLENFDKTWRKNRGDNQAIYYNVPPGKYVFRVKASNLYGNWNEKSLAIMIEPPWYKTTLAYLFYTLMLITAIFGFDRYMRRRIVQRERQKAQERELAQAKEIEKAYTELKATQSQLIQAEKMASLGELTAGIAHEIQNPLNFVNNFSDLNKELLLEMKGEIKKGNIDEVQAIADDVINNEEKINHHGKRADSIVKNMLQHSRSHSDIKEPTDINALADEYLRLSYHGLRAKDKSFTAEYKLVADEKLPKVNVVPQDIGRVLLNLINNAFFAVNEKAKQNGSEYKPVVTISTGNSPLRGGKGSVEIRVEDNGAGIPESVKEKIFQPFFTTKPAGQGTGLGLSLSYDIIKKGHNGNLRVETEEGKGTKFIITLPL